MKHSKTQESSEDELAISIIYNDNYSNVGENLLSPNPQTDGEKFENKSNESHSKSNPKSGSSLKSGIEKVLSFCARKKKIDNEDDDLPTNSNTDAPTNFDFSYQGPPKKISLKNNPIDDKVRVTVQDSIPELNNQNPERPKEYSENKLKFVSGGVSKIKEYENLPSDVKDILDRWKTSFPPPDEVPQLIERKVSTWMTTNKIVEKPSNALKNASKIISSNTNDDKLKDNYNSISSITAAGQKNDSIISGDAPENKANKEMGKSPASIILSKSLKPEIIDKYFGETLICPNSLTERSTLNLKTNEKNFANKDNNISEPISKSMASAHPKPVDIAKSILARANHQSIAPANNMLTVSANQKSISTANDKSISSANSKSISTANNKSISIANDKSISSANQKSISTANNKSEASANPKSISTANNKSVASANPKSISTANNKSVASANPKSISTANNKSVASANPKSISTANNKSVKSAANDKSISSVSNDANDAPSSKRVWFQKNQDPSSIRETPQSLPHTSIDRSSIFKYKNVKIKCDSKNPCQRPDCDPNNPCGRSFSEDISKKNLANITRPSYKRIPGKCRKCEEENKACGEPDCASIHQSESNDDKNSDTLGNSKLSEFSLRKRSTMLSGAFRLKSIKQTDRESVLKERLQPKIQNPLNIRASSIAGNPNTCLLSFYIYAFSSDIDILKPFRINNALRDREISRRCVIDQMDHRVYACELKTGAEITLEDDQTYRIRGLQYHKINIRAKSFQQARYAYMILHETLPVLMKRAIRDSPAFANIPEMDFRDKRELERLMKVQGLPKKYPAQSDKTFYEINGSRVIQNDKMHLLECGYFKAHKEKSIRNECHFCGITHKTPE